MITRLRLSLLLVVALLATPAMTCNHAPPNLSPEAHAKFNNTRVIKTLDLLRDTAVDASKETPPIFSEAATIRVVTFHRSALLIIDASASGWQAAVSTLLDELQHDKTFLPSELQMLAPYFGLGKSVIKEIP